MRQLPLLLVQPFVAFSFGAGEVFSVALVLSAGKRPARTNWMDAELANTDLMEDGLVLDE